MILSIFKGLINFAFVLSLKFDETMFNYIIYSIGNYTLIEINNLGFVIELKNYSNQVEY